MKQLLLLLLTVAALLLGGADFSNASIVLLYNKEDVFVNADGTSTVTDDCTYQVMNYQGLTELQKLQMHFNTDYGTLQVIKLAIIKPDGRHIELDPQKNSSIAVEDSQMASNIYDPAQKILNVTVPGLEIGDKLQVITLEKNTKSRMAGQWSDIAVLQAPFPIVHYEYRVSLPENKPLQGIAVKDEVPNTITSSKTVKDGRIIYSWTAKNVPQIVPEIAMPAMYTCIQRLLLSTVKEWEDISRWYDQLCAPHLAKVNEAMRQKTAELTADKKNDMAKIHALFQFVSQQIRYTGITDEDGAPGYEPHDVDKTFNQKHGVCRDKAALLTAMLRLAGFKAFPVLFMSGAPKDKEVANIYFNHAIVGVETSAGNYLLMDPTFETTTELFPGYLAGFPYLAAKPAGDTLRLAPPVPPQNNMLQITTSAEMQQNAVAVKTILDFTGTYDQMYRAAFSEWTPDDVKNFLSAQLRKIAPGAKLQKMAFQPENIRDMSKPLQVSLTYTVPNTLKNTEIQLLQMPRGAMVFGLLDSLARTTALENRRFPLRALPRMVKEIVTLKLIPDMEVTAPQAVNIREQGIFQVQGNFSRQGDMLKEEFTFAVESMLIAPADYHKFKSAVSRAQNMWQTLPVIARKSRFDDTVGSGANIAVVKQQHHYIINDDHSWIQKIDHTFKVLNYAGVQEISNISVNFIDGVESLQIAGSVIQSDGKIHQLTEKDINYMDMPATAAAPRYCRRKTAVISFPGVTVGSTVNCQVTHKTAEQPFFYAQLVTAENTPARERSLIIEYPAKMALKFSDIPANINDSSTMGGKRIIRRFSARNIPRLAYEPGQAAYSLFAPTIRISSGNFKQLNERITAAANEKTAHSSAEIAELAKKITSDVSADKMLKEIFNGSEKFCNTLAKIFAVEKFVYKNIRFVDLPMNKMLLREFSLPQTTLKQGYGNSVDRAILMAAMLKELDIKYEFVPLASQQSTAEEKIQMNEIPENNFDKLLLYLPEYSVFLNDSGLYGIPGHLRSAYSAIYFDGGLRDLLTPATAQLDIINCHIDLQQNHSADITLKYSYTGTSHEVEAERFARFTPPLEKQYIETLAAAISPDARIVEYKFTPEYAYGKTDLLLKVKVPDFAKVSGKFIAVQLPEYGKFSSSFPLSPQLRKNPFLSRKQNHLLIEYQISTPENYTIMRREPTMHVYLPAVFARINYHQEEKNLHQLSFFIAVYNTITAADDFPRLLELKETIDHLNTKTILFTAEQ